MKARRGELDGFELVYRRNTRVVLAFLGRQLSSPELVADLFSETFAQLLVLVVRETERPIPRHPPSWLVGTARHLMIDSFRRGRVDADARRRLAMEPLALEDSDLLLIDEAAADGAVWEQFMATLPADQRAALSARIIDEREYGAIAAELQCSEAVVRQRVSRALGTLRRTIEEKNANV
jgi:RNA polymerase sigma factor (sigma-70 family)